MVTNVITAARATIAAPTKSMTANIASFRAAPTGTVIGTDIKNTTIKYLFNGYIDKDDHADDSDIEEGELEEQKQE